jgi:hypothetical protein
MTRRGTSWRLLLPAVLLLAATSCYDDTEVRTLITELRAEHELVEDQLETWTDPAGPRTTSIQTWAIQAGRAICDIMAANPPNSKYAQSTRDFCGAGDPPPGEPGDPPDWGD